MSQLSQRTVAFLVKGNKVLLGYKKTGFGKGNYLGIGGKIEAGESEIEAAARELTEEVNISQPSFKKVGDFTFLFPEKPDWSQQVHAFLSEQWHGEPIETNEIRPEWLDKHMLPLSKMWDDAQFWLPAILNNHSLRGTFTFNTDLKVSKCEMTETMFK